MTYQGSGVNTTLDQLVTQLATQHADNAAKLDAILAALGAPPPTATVTLADVLTAIQLTNTKLDALAGYLSTIATQTNLTRVALDSWIDDWFSGAGGLQYLENIYFGMQDVRSAIIATACPCNTESPLLPAPGDTTPFPTEQQQELCKRAQKFVDWFLQEVLIRVRDVYTTFGFVGAAALGVLLAAALAALAPETAGASLIPSLAIASIVSLVGSVGASQLGGIVSYYNNAGVRNALISAIYTSASAASAKNNFDAAIDTLTDVPSPIRAIWKALSLQIFFDQTFDPNNVIDTSGYSGTFCSGLVSECYEFTTQFLNGAWRVVLAAPPLPSVTNTPIPPFSVSTYDGTIFGNFNAAGWTFYGVSGPAASLAYATPGGSIISIPSPVGAEPPAVLPAMTIFTITGGENTVIRLCTPEPPPS